MKTFFRTTILLQYAAVITANLSTIVAGMGLVWSSPVLGQLMDENQTILSRPITDQEAAWLVSAPYFSGIFTSFFAIYLIENLGRRNCVIMSCVPRIGTALMYLFAHDIWVILLGRAISGPLDTLTFVTVPTYAAEIASKEIRGALGTILQIMSSVGILITLGIGPFVPYTTLNIILLCMSVACSIPLLFLPDTPYFLYSKGKTDDAQKLLIKLRGSDTLANEEIKEYQAASQEQVATVTMRELIKNKLFLKAALISVFSIFCAHTNGYTVVINYLQPTLEMTNTSVSPEIASLVIGSIQLLASFCVSLISEKFGRKPILISTTVGVAIGLIGLGTFFKVQERQETVTGFMNFLPLVSIILIVYCHSAGLAAIIWVLMSEIFEGRTRAVGTTLTLFVNFVTAFTVTLTLPTLLNSIGPAFTYWTSSIICTFFCVFIFVFVPETKGKSFAEIQRLLGKRCSDGETIIP